MHIQLKLLTPLHIGGSDSAVYPMSYVNYRGKVHVISDHKLSRQLVAMDLLDDFLTSVTNTGNRFSLGRYLQNRNLYDADFIHSITIYTCKTTNELNREFRPFVRNAYARPFVPGTSLKGVLRTAILYCALKRLSESKRQQVLDNFISQEIKSLDPRKWVPDYRKKFFYAYKEQQFFQSFQLPNLNKKGQHSDILRVLSATDSPAFNKDELIIRAIKIYSAHSSENPKRFTIYAECLPAGTTIDFNLTIDESLLQDFKKSNDPDRHRIWGLAFRELEHLISNPLACVREMTQDVIAHEKEFFQAHLDEDWPLSEEPDVRLGWGGSLLSTSVSLLLPEPLRIEMRNRLFRPRGDAPAPKSRKRLFDHPQKGAELGWAKIVE